MTRLARAFVGVAALALVLVGFGLSTAASTGTWTLLGHSLSADPAGWAFSPTIAAASDGTLYAAWSQHMNPAAWQLVGTYVKRWSGTGWQSLGGRIGNRQTRDGSAMNVTGYSPSLAVLGSIPYVGWYEGGGYGWGASGSTAIRSSVFVAHWDGTQWVFDRDPAMPNGALNTAPGAAARSPKLAVVGSLLHAAWIETRGISNSDAKYNVIVVKRLIGGRWIQVGPEFFAGQSIGEAKIIDLAIADLGNVPHVAWSELKRGARPEPSRVHVARLEPDRWAMLGGPLNASPDGYANYLAMTSLGDALYVAWQERPVGGNNRVYVRSWKGGTWGPSGTSLNVDPAQGEAGRPALTADGTRVWLAWAEGAPRERSALHVRALFQRAWSDPSPPLNVAPGEGAADHPALTSAAGRPMLAWAEKIPPPATKQVHVREGQ